MKHTKNNPDYTKNKTSDVVKHGSGPIWPMHHYEHNQDLTPHGSDHPGHVFLPREGKNRPTTHVKINECDH